MIENKKNIKKLRYKFSLATVKKNLLFCQNNKQLQRVNLRDSFLIISKYIINDNNIKQFKLKNSLLKFFLSKKNHKKVIKGQMYYTITDFFFLYNKMQFTFLENNTILKIITYNQQFIPDFLIKIYLGI